MSYLAALTIVFLIAMVLTRVVMLKAQGIEAVKFGAIDKKDFFIPPFAFLYFYLVFANAFELPTIHNQEIFRVALLAWIGVVFCGMGLALVFYSLVSFRKSFRVGIDLGGASDGLITTGVFALSRNPMYASFGLVLFGQFLIFPSWIFLVYLVAVCWLFQRQVLEEEFLEKHFRKEYEAYRKRVRRYI